MIVGDREKAQVAALQAGAACLIVIGETRQVAPAVLALAAERGATVISSPHDTYATARLLNLSLPVAEFMREPEQTVAPDDLATDLAAALNGPGRAPAGRGRRGPVCGIVSRGDLLRGRRKRVILVDHNHRSQAVEGLEEAELLGVIDHHNLGDLHTAAPIRLILEPVGCTATIITRALCARQSRAGAVDRRAAAGGDHLRHAALHLADDDRARPHRGGIAGRDRRGWRSTTFAHELFAARSDFSATTPGELVASNLEDYDLRRVNAGDRAGGDAGDRLLRGAPGGVRRRTGAAEGGGRL